MYFAHFYFQDSWKMRRLVENVYSGDLINYLIVLGDRSLLQNTSYGNQISIFYRVPWDHFCIEIKILPKQKNLKWASESADEAHLGLACLHSTSQVTGADWNSRLRCEGLFSGGLLRDWGTGGLLSILGLSQVTESRDSDFISHGSLSPVTLFPAWQKLWKWVPPCSHLKTIG